MYPVFFEDILASALLSIRISLEVICTSIYIHILWDIKENTEILQDVPQYFTVIKRKILATWRILLWLLRDVIYGTNHHTEWDMTDKNMRKIFIYCFHLLQANNFLDEVGGESPEESYYEVCFVACCFLICCSQKACTVVSRNKQQTAVYWLEPRWRGITRNPN